MTTANLHCHRLTARNKEFDMDDKLSFVRKFPGECWRSGEFPAALAPRLYNLGARWAS